MKSVKLMFAVIGVVVGLAVAMWLVSVLPGSLNPFSETTHDRSQPAVLKSISDLGELRTASANLQIVIDVEKDTRFLPDFIKGERDLFVAVGSVDAGVDLTTSHPRPSRWTERPPRSHFPIRCTSTRTSISTRAIS